MINMLWLMVSNVTVRSRDENVYLHPLITTSENTVYYVSH